MRKYMVLPILTLAFSVVAVTVAGQSPEPFLGTWKVNVAKSTYSPARPSTPQSELSIWEALGDGQFKNTITTVNAKGETTHLELVTKLDGADAPLKGAAVPTTRAYKRIDSHTYEYVHKVNGKVMTTTIQVVAPDGKTRTITTTGTNAQGQPVKSVVLYEKQ